MKKIYLVIIFALSGVISQAQNNVGIGTTTPNASAALDVVSTDKGLLIPRMTTTQRTAISLPATGLLVFDNTTGGFWFYNGSAWVDLSTSNTTISEIADADNNTKIQVEESANEEIIRFDMAGTEFFTMDNGRLEVLNTGSSVFIGEGAGANDDLSNNGNVFIGQQAGNANTSGNSNTANGYQALYLNSTGDANTANGSQALYYNTTGSNNTATGLQALYFNTTGDENIANGIYALYTNNDGALNIATGGSALFSNISGSYNTANGRTALYSNTTGDYNTANGISALFSNTTGSKNTALGSYADVSSGNLTNATAIGYNAKVATSNSLVLGGTGTNAVNVGIGTTSPSATLDVEGTVQITGGSPASGKVLTSTDANGNAVWQSNSTLTDADNNTKIQVEESPNEDIIRFDMGGTEFFTMDNGRLGVLNTGNSVFIGEGAGANDDLGANLNTFVGHQAGNANTNGVRNTANGYQSLYRNTTGDDNTAIGQFSLYANILGNKNTAIGVEADVTSNNLTNATAIGYSARVSTSNSLVLGSIGALAVNVGIGTTSPSATLDVVGTVQITGGFPASGKVLTSTDAFGNAVWQTVATTVDLADTDNNTKIQVEESTNEDIIRFDMAGTEFFTMDNGRLEVLNTGRSVFIGEGAGANDDLNINFNVFIGYQAGNANSTGSVNTAIGYKALPSNTGTGNTANGSSSLLNNTTGDYNTASGNSALLTNTTGSYNTALGYNAGVISNNLTSATAIGYNAKVATSNSMVLGGTGANAVNVGIGTTSPTNNLHIRNIGDASIYIEADYNNDGETDNPFIKLSQDGNSVAGLLGLCGNGGVDPENNLYTDAEWNAFLLGTTTLDGPLQFGTNSAVRMTILNDGKVGIGTTSPTSLFHVSDGRVEFSLVQDASGTAGSGVLEIGSSLRIDNNEIITNMGTVLFLQNDNGGDLSVDQGTFYVDGANNRVGIGTSSPTKGKLEISGFVSTSLQPYGYLNSFTPTGTSGSSIQSISLYASDGIAALNFRAFSDQRIKNIKGISNAKADLNTIMQIEITDYTMIDVVEKGNQTYKKVIAQQVDKVYPQAVSKNLTDVVPDIYKRAEMKEGWIILETNLKVGERVKLITEENAEIYSVTEAETSKFKVDSKLNTNDLALVFVYGREVNDFHTVDYEAIAMLNVSATQAQQKLIEDLQAKVISLETQNIALQSETKKISSLQKEMAEIKAMLGLQANAE